MTNDGKINVANIQANVTQDAADKDYTKKRNVANMNEKVPLEVESNERLTFQEPYTTQASKDDVKVLPEDVLFGREWFTKVNAGIDAIEIFSQCFRKVEGTLSYLVGHTFEEIENI
uniref:Uncharacterized protein n=1 Tax=Solanum tuberosum TaxID=4113 RepID=M1AU46_SOLTU